ncbi:hypothetical protein DSO57_1028038 [Entomophthora muscae]|uniref:Uncharacterized protein n=1 Tax=Entomophthora muscae TaxID=34485 RepID=A0ACC2TCW7_9FUNG|nr:hypothetical protein DSO57_1028038 [Entomophthora muscae]
MFFILAIVSLLLFVAWWICSVVYSIFFSPLKDIPSPLIFQILPIYYHISVATGTSTFLLFHYHLAYGPVFRVGWNYVMFVNREAAEALYSTYDCKKTSMYEGFALFSPTMFSTLSRTLHTKRKKIVAPALTRSSMVDLEPLATENGVRPVLEFLDRCAAADQPADMFKLLNHMSWDIIGSVLLGKSFGMVRNNGHPILLWTYQTLWFSMACIIFPFLKPFRPTFKTNIEKVSCISIDANL